MNLTSGEASIAGFSTRTQRRQIYNVLGICPQFDVLWADLTVQEHLLLYARLNGVPVNVEIARARQVAEQVRRPASRLVDADAPCHLERSGASAPPYGSVRRPEAASAYLWIAERRAVDFDSE